jgi:hypothetical protein
MELLAAVALLSALPFSPMALHITLYKGAIANPNTKPAATIQLKRHARRLFFWAFSEEVLIVPIRNTVMRHIEL